MPDRAPTVSPPGAELSAVEFSDEEIAAWLTEQEGRQVSVVEVRRIGTQAMRKVKQALLARGLTYHNMMPDR